LPPKEKTKVIAPNCTEISFTADDELISMMTRFKELTGHQNAHSGHLELLKSAFRIALKQVDPEQKRVRSLRTTSPLSTPTPESKPKQIKNTAFPSFNPDYIPSQTKKTVRIRENGECGFVSRATGQRCGSRFGLEFDHIIPKALGGESTSENLRLVCRTHNQWHAIQALGPKHMAKYIPSLKDGMVDMAAGATLTTHL
jgi:5-methylcytosine-specific restriction endonuclease McrA